MPENVNVDDELNKIAGGILGDSSTDAPAPAPAPDPEQSEEQVEDSIHWGFGDLSFDDAERLAYRRMEEYAHEQYAATSKRMVMDGFGGSVVLGGVPLTERMITNLVYEMLLQNRDKYFVTPEQCPTAATDGEAIYINPYFTAWLTPQELAFVLAHEVNHIMLHHVGEIDRSESFIYGYKARKDPKNIDKSKNGLYNFRASIANIAEDLIINDQLVKDKIGTLPLYKSGPRKGQTMCCYVPGFAEYSAEESIVKFSNIVCKNGYELVHKKFAERGIDVEPPKYKESLDVTDARQELERLYDYIYEVSSKFHEQQKEEEQKQQGNNGQGQGAGQSSQGQSGQSQGGSEQGQSTGSGGSGQNNGQEQSNGQGQNGGQEPEGQGGSGSSGSGQSGKGSQRGRGGSNKQSGRGGQGGSAGRPPINADGDLDRMASGAIGEVIDNILNDKAVDDLASSIADALAKGMGGGQALDSHETTGDLLNDIAKEKNGDVSDIEKQVSESAGILASKVIEKLESNYGVTPDQLKGIGNIGANIVAKWEARQVKARRPYDVMLMRMFKLVKGQSRDTYARHNKKTTVINKALKNYARKTGTEPSKVIIPNKLSESGKIVIAIDTSGSIFADPKIGTMAVEEILRLTDTLNRQYMGSAIEVVMCDTELHKYGLASNRYEMQKMLDQVKNKGINVVGGGGTDLLPIWEYVLDETTNARKKGQLPPSGLLVLTDTYTMNRDKIADLYRDKQFRLPTVILAPSQDIKSCGEWQDLAKECPYFMLADIDAIQERSQSKASKEPERNFCYDMEM